MIKKRLCMLALTCIAIGVVPLIASAHVKWFVDSEQVLSNTAQNVLPFYGITSIEVFIWSIITLLTVLMFGVLDSYIKSPKKILAFGYAHEKGVVYTAQVLLGLFLISVSLLWNIILIPEFRVVGDVTMILKYIQIGIGVLFICNVFSRFASVVLFLMCVMLGFTHGLVAVLENALLITLALFFFIKNSPADSWWNRYNKHALEFVRLGVGITLITLACTEKLMYPELSIKFLEVHQWNFMSGIFPWFTNNLFVLSTGFAELIFGIVFILGYLTRVNTALIACFFAASVVTMFLQFGAWEVEDLVVYSAAVLFIIYGHGRTKFFHAPSPQSWLHRRIVGKVE